MVEVPSPLSTVVYSLLLRVVPVEGQLQVVVPSDSKTN